jgi:pre-mRNA-splicing factor ATP-dependent RNA helicase DHX38/PRP16
MTSETGSGKTTQVPQILLENGRSVVVTQPRRVTTEAGARRVAEEIDVELGGAVGFAHGLEKCYSQDTKILFVTDGYKLIQELNNGSAKRQFDAIVLDEIHEMNSNMLLLLALAREHVQNHSHEESPPKLIIMSATMNAQALSEYMGGAPILSVPGRTFEVKEEEPKDSMELDIAERVENGEEIQVFLPGKREIEGMRKNLQRLGVDADK